MKRSLLEALTAIPLYFPPGIDNINVVFWHHSLCLLHARVLSCLTWKGAKCLCITHDHTRIQRLKSTLAGGAIVIALRGVYAYDRMRVMREESMEESDRKEYLMPRSTRAADEQYCEECHAQRVKYHKQDYNAPPDSRGSRCGNGPRTTCNGLRARLALPDADGQALHRVLQVQV